MEQQQQQPRRIPGRYVVYLMIVFAVLCAAFATWGIRAMRRLPRPPGKKTGSPFGMIRGGAGAQRST